MGAGDVSRWRQLPTGLIRSQADWQQPAALRHSAEQHSGADLGPGGVRALCAG